MKQRHLKLQIFHEKHIFKEVKKYFWNISSILTAVMTFAVLLKHFQVTTMADTEVVHVLFFVFFLFLFFYLTFKSP